MSDRADLLQGTLDLLVLRTLAQGPMHGWGVSQRIEQLSRTLAADDEIVGLREAVERETRIRFDEGVVTSAELVDRSTDVLEARIARATHVIELARSRARYLNLLAWR